MSEMGQEETGMGMAASAKTPNEWSAVRRIVLERDGYRCVA
jgi:hypothetical protein